MKYAIVIGHANASPWQDILTDGLLKTWGTNKVSNLFVLQGRKPNLLIQKIDKFFWLSRYTKPYGKYLYLIEKLIKKIRKNKVKKIIINSNVKGYKELVVQASDLQFNLGQKLTSCLNYFSHSDFDYVVIVSTSSYINLGNLENLLESVTCENFVAGRITIQGQEKLLSGSCRIFSRDAIIEIGKNLSQFDYSLPEDLALTRVLRTMEVETHNITSIDISELSELENFTKRDLERVIHFRLKSGPLNSRNDVKIFHKLHQKLNP